jgi:hypothetical protein
MSQTEEVMDMIVQGIEELGTPHTLPELNPVNTPELAQELKEWCQEVIHVIEQHEPDIAEAEKADQAESDLLIQDRNQEYEDSVL